MTQEPQRDTRATRRGVLAGVGLVGLAGAVSACSSGGSSSSSAGNGAGATSAATAPASTPSTSSSAGTSGNASSVLATTSEIPVGSGKIFTAEKVVVTQPTAGDIKAFSAICTHMGCIVSKISNGTIDCPCHGSQYSIKNGAVVAGPAPAPLPAQPIKVSGNDITLG